MFNFFPDKKIRQMIKIAQKKVNNQFDYISIVKRIRNHQMILQIKDENIENEVIDL